MEENRNGWVVVNNNHPNNPKAEMITTETFACTRTESIKLFIKGSGRDWRYWRRKYNFRCVRAILTIIT